MTSTAKEHLPLGGRMLELFSPLSPATLKTSPAEQNTIPVCVSTAPLPGRIKLVKKNPQKVEIDPSSEWRVELKDETIRKGE